MEIYSTVCLKTYKAANLQENPPIDLFRNRFNLKCREIQAMANITLIPRRL